MRSRRMCAAVGCQGQVTGSQFVCTRHWHELPQTLYRAASMYHQIRRRLRAAGADPAVIERVRRDERILHERCVLELGIRDCIDIKKRRNVLLGMLRELPGFNDGAPGEILILRYDQFLETQLKASHKLRKEAA